MFPYQILRFGWSNASQNGQNQTLCFLCSPARRRFHVSSHRQLYASRTGESRRRLSGPSRQTSFLALPSRLHPEPELLALLVCPEAPPLAVPAILRRHAAVLRALEPLHLTPHPYSTAPTTIGPLPGQNRSCRPLTAIGASSSSSPLRRAPSPGPHPPKSSPR